MNDSNILSSLLSKTRNSAGKQSSISAKIYANIDILWENDSFINETQVYNFFLTKKI